MPAPLAIRAGHQGETCMDCVCPLALARQLESVVGRTCSLASERQLENVLTPVSLGFRMQWEKAFSVHMCWLSAGAGKCCGCSCLPAPARELQSSATTILSGFSEAVGWCQKCSLLPVSSQVGRRVPHLSMSTCANRIGGEYKIGICQHLSFSGESFT